MTTPTNHATQKLYETAAQCRSFLLPRWAIWHLAAGGTAPRSASQDMCRFTAFFLHSVLPAATGLYFEVHGGTPADRDRAEIEVGTAFPAGCRDLDGQWHGHYWVVDTTHGLVVDITGDQFGHAPIVVTSSPEHLRRNYLPGAIDDHAVPVENVVRRWVTDWRNSPITSLDNGE